MMFEAFWMVLDETYLGNAVLPLIVLPASLSSALVHDTPEQFLRTSSIAVNVLHGSSFDN